jgi:hypothetical protein
MPESFRTTTLPYPSRRGEELLSSPYARQAGARRFNPYTPRRTAFTHFRAHELSTIPSCRIATGL